jgi:hypothetical protein
MVSKPSRGKLFRLIERNLLPVDNKDYYSDEDDHEAFVMDELDDTHSLASKDDS